MCQYSATAKNSRNAEQRENLVVSQAPHAGGHWLTERGKPDVAVCTPGTVVLAVQIPNQPVRGARFFHLDENNFQRSENYDFLNFIDGKQESIALNDIPIGTGVRVLQLSDEGQPIPKLPRAINSTIHTSTPDPGNENAEDLVLVNAGSGDGADPVPATTRRRIQIPFFDF